MKRVVKSSKKTKREEILDAGIRLFARLPFSEITIAAVAREANCGHSLVYHYFKNINEIYDDSITYVTNLLIPFITQIEKCTISPELAFVGGISRLVDALKDQKMDAYYLSLVSFSHIQAPYSEKLVKVRKAWNKAFLRIISDAQKNGALITSMTAESILRSIIVMFQGLVSAQIFNNAGKRNAFRASDLYLPFLKGAH